MTLPSEIFKAYDIRGIVGRTLTPDIVRTIGHGLGTLAREAKRPAIAIGRDGRLSGPELSQALSDGIRAAGTDVIDVGMVATPMTYFASHALDTGCSDGHGQPQPARLQRSQDGDRRHDAAGDAIQRLRERLLRGDASAALPRPHVGGAYLDHRMT